MRTDTIGKTATKEGSFTKVEIGDARAVRKPEKRRKREKKKTRGEVINQRRTRRCSYYMQAEKLRTRRNYTGFTSRYYKYARGWVLEQTLDPEMLAPSR